MQDLNDKITGNTLTAAEWNEVPSEIQNVIEALAITLSSGDLNQLGKAIAGYVANGTFYTDSGIANAYVLSVIGSKQRAPAYTNGFRISFLAGNENTGASTVNVAGLGVKNILLSGGIALAAGDVSGQVELTFDSANDRFQLLNAKVTGRVVEFDSTVEMKNSPDLVAKMKARTLGFTTKGDGGGGDYNVVLTSSVTPNEFNIITGVFDASISFDLLFVEPINGIQFGIKGDGVTNDTPALQALLDTSVSVYLPDRSYALSATPILKHSRQSFLCDGKLVLTGASGTAALQIGIPGTFNVDEARVYINNIEGQDNTAGRNGIEYRYAVDCDVYVQKINNCKNGHHPRQTVDAARFVHNNIGGNIIRACDRGIFQEDSPGGVTEADNEGNDFNVNLITGCVKAGFEIDPDVRTSGSHIVINFDAGNNFFINKSDFGQANNIFATDLPESTSDSTGDTDGSTAVITGMTDTSTFLVGELVFVSAGFTSPTTELEILSKTATSITVDINSTSVQSNITVSSRANVFADRDNLLTQGLFRMGFTTGTNTLIDWMVSSSQTGAQRWFRGGVEASRTGHAASNSDYQIFTGVGAVPQADFLSGNGVRLRNRIFFDGERNDTFGAGNNNDQDPTAAAFAWRIIANAAGSDLTGIAGGSKGRMLKILNVTTAGAFNLTLKNEDAASGSGNRILTPGGADVVIAQNGSVDLFYDSTSSRWRVDVQ